MASRASAAVAGWQAATTPPASIRNRIQPMPSCAADAALAQHPLRSKDGAGAHVPALFLRLPTGGRPEGRSNRAEDFSCGADRKSVRAGKSVAVRVNIGGGRINEKKTRDEKKHRHK